MAGVGTHVGIAVLQRQSERRRPVDAHRVRVSTAALRTSRCGSAARGTVSAPRPSARSRQRPDRALTHLPRRLSQRAFDGGQIGITASHGAKRRQRGGAYQRVTVGDQPAHRIRPARSVENRWPRRCSPRDSRRRRPPPPRRRHQRTPAPAPPRCAPGGRHRSTHAGTASPSPARRELSTYTATPRTTGSSKTAASAMRSGIGQHLDEFAHTVGGFPAYRGIGITKGAQQCAAITVREMLDQHVHRGASHAGVGVGQISGQVSDGRVTPAPAPRLCAATAVERRGARNRDAAVPGARLPDERRLFDARPLGLPGGQMRPGRAPARNTVRPAA